MNIACHVVKDDLASGFTQGANPNEQSHHQRWHDVPREDCRQTWNFYVADMQRLDLFAVGQINLERLGGDSFIDDVDAVHNEDGHCAGVGDSMIMCDRDRIEGVCQRGRGRGTEHGGTRRDVRCDYGIIVSAIDQGGRTNLGGVRSGCRN